MPMLTRKTSFACTLIAASLAACGGDAADDPAAGSAAGATDAVASEALRSDGPRSEQLRSEQPTPAPVQPMAPAPAFAAAPGAPAQQAVAASGAQASLVESAMPVPQPTPVIVSEADAPSATTAPLAASAPAPTPDVVATLTAVAPVWTRIGTEGDTLDVPAGSTVRYGANGVYLTRVVSGRFTATNAFFGGDPVYGVRKSVELQSAPATTWTRIGGEGQALTVAADTTVRYGADGRYIVKVVSGTFTATNAFFGGDPYYGRVKSVEALGTGTGPAPTPLPVPTGAVIRVGPGQAVATLAQAARLARDGDTIEIAAGTYTRDVAVFPQSRLTIRGTGGRPVLDAAGTGAVGKGILVIQGDEVSVENLELRNAKVADQNGAGIRQEGGGRLVVRNVVFRGNEEGILTSNDARASLEVHDSQFIDNAFAYAGGYSHAIYVGRIGRFVMQGSFVTGTQSGHLVKSRARETRLLYNRFTSERGSPSYEVDLPNGGAATLIGNLVEQGAATENSVIVSYGGEGLGAWPTNTLDAVANTLVNRRASGCVWLWAAAGSRVRLADTLLANAGGGCRMVLPVDTVQAGVFAATDADFVAPTAYDFRLRAGSALRGRWVDPGRSASGASLAPTLEYRHPAATLPLTTAPVHPGAFQSGQ